MRDEKSRFSPSKEAALVMRDLQAKHPIADHD
jgi:hypothetical protein